MVYINKSNLYIIIYNYIIYIYSDVKYYLKKCLKIVYYEFYHICIIYILNFVFHFH